MKICFFIFFSFLFFFPAHSQTVSAALNEAYKQFLTDPQLKSSTSSLYILNARNGKVVFDYNAEVGMAPASTLKTITSITAYELLGEQFTFKTKVGLITHNNKNTLLFKASGDPTLGSERWAATKEDVILNEVIESIKKKGVTQIDEIIVDTKGWEEETIPDGWIWQDIGNYFGAAAQGLNWKENVYHIVLKSGASIGSPVQIVKTDPDVSPYKIASLATAAASGTGDKAYIYFPIGDNKGMVRGTIPVNEKAFVISGAMPSPEHVFAQALKNKLFQNRLLATDVKITLSSNEENHIEELIEDKIIYTHESPTLDKIVYWLNKKSINLYAEALLKQLAFTKKGTASTTVGTDLVKAFWKEKGIDPVALNIFDGSGLSPLNRISTKAQATILHYAVTQPWFNSFYASLPEYNGMKIKSGTINNTKGFAGYYNAPGGESYIISFLVNNYNGPSSAMVQKMYKVLNVLK